MRTFYVVALAALASLAACDGAPVAESERTMSGPSAAREDAREAGEPESETPPGKPEGAVDPIRQPEGT